MLFPLTTGNWRAGMRLFSDAVDDSMGEMVLVTPAHAPKPNYPSVPNPAKAVTVVAAFMAKSKTILMGEGGKIGGHSLSPLVQTTEPIFSFGYSVLPWPIQQSYRITRPCSGETFEVTNVKPDGVARIVCTVVQLGMPKDSPDPADWRNVLQQGSRR
jgi:hypothetical protein